MGHIPEFLMRGPPAERDGLLLAVPVKVFLLPVLPCVAWVCSSWAPRWSHAAGVQGSLSHVMALSSYRTNALAGVHGGTLCVTMMRKMQCRGGTAKILCVCVTGFVVFKSLKVFLSFWILRVGRALHHLTLQVYKISPWIYSYVCKNIRNLLVLSLTVTDEKLLHSSSCYT